MESLNRLVSLMVQQTHYDRNQLLTVYPELSKNLIRVSLCACHVAP
jgi:hypothetical protein